jgi:hypothetical protein
MKGEWRIDGFRGADHAEKSADRKKHGQACFAVRHPFRRLRLVHGLILFGAVPAPSTLISLSAI